jgi:hypothetical protein
MNEKLPKNDTGGRGMEYLLIIGFLAAWLILQIWVLPRFGVKT